MQGVVREKLYNRLGGGFFTELFHIERVKPSIYKNMEGAEILKSEVKMNKNKTTGTDGIVP